MRSLNSVITSLDAFFILIAVSSGTLRDPLTYLEKADLFKPMESANFVWFKHFLFKYSFKVIITLLTMVDSKINIYVNRRQ